VAARKGRLKLPLKPDGQSGEGTFFFYGQSGEGTVHEGLDVHFRMVLDDDQNIPRTFIHEGLGVHFRPRTVATNSGTSPVRGRTNISSCSSSVRGGVVGGWRGGFFFQAVRTVDSELFMQVLFGRGEEDLFSFQPMGRPKMPCFYSF